VIERVRLLVNSISNRCATAIWADEFFLAEAVETEDEAERGWKISQQRLSRANEEEKEK
jgi:hypothetical protein